MRDITCCYCKAKVVYKWYSEYLQRIQFIGVPCGNCGQFQPIRYQIVKGKGRKIITRYLPPGNTKRFKVQRYHSCPVCNCYWEDADHQNCPFCGAFVINDEVERVNVLGIKKISEEFKKEQKKWQLKVDFMNCEGKINLLDFGKESADYVELKINYDQKNILSKLSELECKLKQ